MLLRCAREQREQGKVPPGVRDGGVYRVRGAAKIVPQSVYWVDGAKEDVTVPGFGAVEFEGVINV